MKGNRRVCALNFLKGASVSIYFIPTIYSWIVSDYQLLQTFCSLSYLLTDISVLCLCYWLISKYLWINFFRMLRFSSPEHKPLSYWSATKHGFGEDLRMGEDARLAIERLWVGYDAFLSNIALCIWARHLTLTCLRWWVVIKSFRLM